MPRKTASTTTASSPVPMAHGHRLTADERRAEVIGAAVRAFASGGYHGTSTEEIARLAGVSQPYLFRLFGTKRELFLAAVDRAMTQIGDAFEDAARDPVPSSVPDFPATLAAMGMRYHALLADRSLLRIQLHAFAASDDPEIRAFVRERFAGLVTKVSRLSGVPAESLRSFFADGMLINVAAALELSEADVAWTVMCEGVGDPNE